MAQFGYCGRLGCAADCPQCIAAASAELRGAPPPPPPPPPPQGKPPQGKPPRTQAEQEKHEKHLLKRRQERAIKKYLLDLSSYAIPDAEAGPSASLH